MATPRRNFEKLYNLTVDTLNLRCNTVPMMTKGATNMKTIQRTSVGAAELQREAQKCKNHYLHGSAFSLICSAYTNADDTCHEEGVTEKAENFNEFWSDMFWGSLEGLLSDVTVSATVCDWFKRRGVRF